MGRSARRPGALLPVAVGGMAAAVILSLRNSQANSTLFLGATPGKTQLMRGSTIMHGFKEDFEQWRGTLSADEKSLIQQQAQGEFNKAYRKTDDFKKDLPDEKVKSFSKILGKFFENESEDYKKTAETRPLDYDGLLKKAGDKKLDLRLKLQLSEVDRDAERRYQFATQKSFKREKLNQPKFPQSSPLEEIWSVDNDDEKAHAAAKGIITFMSNSKSDPACPAWLKPVIEEWEKKGVPPMGEKFDLLLPEQMINQFRTVHQIIADALVGLSKNMTKEEVDEITRTQIPEIAAGVAKELQVKYVEARDEVQKEADGIKNFYKSQADRKGFKGTKADILKEIWAELPEFVDKPVPPLDPEVLAQLDVPAITEDSFMHNWGTADRLYKSEAIDAFGLKYLLGVYETKDEAIKAFDEWNAEYTDARKDLASELAQWAKTEQTRLDGEVGPGTERIKKMLEVARR